MNESTDLDTKLEKILLYFTVSDLKRFCKEFGVKGYSRLNKENVINLLVNSISEEEKDKFLKTKGRSKLLEVIRDACRYLQGDAVSRENLMDLSHSDLEVTAVFTGANWRTEFSGRLDEICAPDFNYSCSCRVANSGGLCIHFWAVIIYCLKLELLRLDCLNDFLSLIEADLKQLVKKTRIELKKEKLPADLPVEELIKGMTSKSRYEKARVELG
ncbi:MAG: hypothetical protein ACTSRA_17615, partial [Promethearchaeota archaeon]